MGFGCCGPASCCYFGDHSVCSHLLPTASIGSLYCPANALGRMRPRSHEQRDPHLAGDGYANAGVCKHSCAYTACSTHVYAGCHISCFTDTDIRAAAYGFAHCFADAQPHANCNPLGEPYPHGDSLPTAHPDRDSGRHSECNGPGGPRSVPFDLPVR